jgi:hypothetical protein
MVKRRCLPLPTAQSHWHRFFWLNWYMSMYLLYLAHHTLPLNEQVVAPSHVPDNAAPHCQLCPTPFTLFERRHHCRHCGRVCCADCSSTRLPLPAGFGHGGELVRVCRQCRAVLVAQRKAPPLPPPSGSRPAEYDELAELRRRVVAFSMAHAKEIYSKLK